MKGRVSGNNLIEEMAYEVSGERQAQVESVRRIIWEINFTTQTQGLRRRYRRTRLAQVDYQCLGPPGANYRAHPPDIGEEYGFRRPPVPWLVYGNMSPTWESDH